MKLKYLLLICVCQFFPKDSRSQTGPLNPISLLYKFHAWKVQRVEGLNSGLYPDKYYAFLDFNKTHPNLTIETLDDKIQCEWIGSSPSPNVFKITIRTAAPRCYVFQPNCSTEKKIVFHKEQGHRQTCFTEVLTLTPKTE